MKTLLVSLVFLATAAVSAQASEFDKYIAAGDEITFHKEIVFTNEHPTARVKIREFGEQVQEKLKTVRQSNGRYETWYTRERCYIVAEVPARTTYRINAGRTLKVTKVFFSNKFKDAYGQEQMGGEPHGYAILEGGAHLRCQTLSWWASTESRPNGLPDEIKNWLKYPKFTAGFPTIDHAEQSLGLKVKVGNRGQNTVDL